MVATARSKVVVSHDMARRVFDTAVQWLPAWVLTDPHVRGWDYAVFKFPFVSGFHVCEMESDDKDAVLTHETILSTHKTLHEAMGVCRILLANGGVQYD